jgi:phosphopantothenoylcysteine decarboxylase/phosphopantothenate--cysteine ligase
LVGFAAEVGVTGQALAERARGKLREKACDVVVANEVGRPGVGFGADQNAVTLVFADGRSTELPATRKDILARTIWDRIALELAVSDRLGPDLAEARSKTERRIVRRMKGSHA